MPCLPGKKMSITTLFGKRIQNKISRMSPNKIFKFLKKKPSGNAKIQKLIAKHYVFECFEKRKGEDGKR